MGGVSSPSLLPPVRREDGAPSNWDRYLSLLARQHIPEKAQLRYVRRVEELLKAVAPKALPQLTADEVTEHLRRLSSRAEFSGW